MMPNDPAGTGGYGAGDVAGTNTTALAMQRNIMANERTFSAWLRTGLALIVAAIALPRIIHFVRWAWTLKLVGLIFIAMAAIIFVVAYWRYEAESKKLMLAGAIMTPVWLVQILTLLLLATALISTALLFHE
jgi:putative membrane protein